MLELSSSNVTQKETILHNNESEPKLARWRFRAASTQTLYLSNYFVSNFRKQTANSRKIYFEHIF